jgi:hypothetical protein
VLGDFTFVEADQISGITGGLSARAWARNRPTIGLPHIASVARPRGAVAGRPGGNLANWKPEISLHCDRNASTVPKPSTKAN